MKSIDILRHRWKNIVRHHCWVQCYLYGERGREREKKKVDATINNINNLMYKQTNLSIYQLFCIQVCACAFAYIFLLSI